MYIHLYMYIYIFERAPLSLEQDLRRRTTPLLYCGKWINR